MRLPRFAFALSVVCGFLLLLSVPSRAAAPLLPAPPNDVASDVLRLGDPPVITYTTRAIFATANPNLPVEDFEAGNVAPNEITACPAPLNGEFGSACFAATTLIEGFEMGDRPRNNLGGGSAEGMALLGAGFGGVLSKAVLSNFATDAFEMTFSTPTYAVGFDLIAIGSVTVTVSVYDTLEDLIYTVERPANAAGSNFFGIRTPAQIGRVVLSSGVSEGVDDVAFGNPGNVGAVGMALTVGTDSNECATTDTVAVVPGMTVYYCYRITNNSAYTLSYHRLFDNPFGLILDGVFYGLPPGDTVTTHDLGIPLAQVITTDTVQGGTWTVGEVAGYDAFSQDSCDAIDISASGTPLNLTDDGTALVTLPFSFPFYDIFSNQLLIGNNGLVQFNSTANTLPFINRPLPTTGLDYSMMPFWDDWDTETGNVYVQYLTTAAPMATGTGAAGVDTYIIQWDERSHLPGPNADTVTFQLRLYPTIPLVAFCYQDMTSDVAGVSYGGSGTIGMNRDLTYGAQYSYNQPYADSGSGLLFVQNIGGIKFGASATATVTVGYPDINIVPVAIVQTHGTPPQTTTAIVAIENVGEGPLGWNLSDTAASCLNPTDLAWLSADPVGGVIDPNSATNVTLTFDSTGLADGVYEGSLCVSSNDEDEGLLAIPVTLNVTSGAGMKLYLPVIRRG